MVIYNTEKHPFEAHAEFIPPSTQIPSMDPLSAAEGELQLRQEN